MKGLILAALLVVTNGALARSPMPPPRNLDEALQQIMAIYNFEVQDNKDTYTATIAQIAADQKAAIQALRAQGDKSSDQLNGPEVQINAQAAAARGRALTRFNVANETAVSNYYIRTENACQKFTGRGCLPPTKRR